MVLMRGPGKHRIQRDRELSLKTPLPNVGTAQCSPNPDKDVLQLLPSKAAIFSSVTLDCTHRTRKSDMSTVHCTLYVLQSNDLDKYK